ncbi:histone-lysine N-methyltransferase ASHR2 [Ziziphus jujuba]|uniref:Histone-lysine N-methyltransferase ASHR2 n=1 Tax=Ziziphus jujuba TaxID=326968 RepID=A0A6P4A6L7_ZIZJJ|nr:histone-lysine N-methyltransferase ASHR2 [Ziziphus jujuba]
MNMKQMSTSGGELSVVEIEGRGRALVATQSLRAGQIILRDSPILLYSAFPLFPSSATSSSCNCYCDYCFKTLQASSSSSTSINPCPECSVHLFCSPKCLTAARSSSHSPWVCESLRRLRDCPSLLPQQPLECQVQARFLLAAYNLALVSPSHFQTLLTLQGQRSCLNSTDSIATSAQFLHSLISSLCTPPPPPQIPLPQEGWFSIELSATLLAKDKLNAFGLMEPVSEDGHRSVRAYGIYPKASFFNHDCLPNACRFDYVDTNPGPYNTDIIVRMIHDVPQGREICLSYFPVNENYPNRQRRLMEDYGFTCHCDRCKVEANWSDNDDDDDDALDVEQEEEEVMDEDTDQQMEAASESGNEDGGQADSDFPHAYFFLRYMCSRNNCGGTLAPLPPTGDSSSNIMECNVCGNLKNDDGVGGDGKGELSMDE